MKKAFVLLALLTTTSSFGASFMWGTGTTASNFDGTVFNTTDFNVTGSLVLLTSGSASDMWTVTGDSITVANAVSTGTPVTTGAARNKGRINPTYDSMSIANNQVYGMYITYVDADNNVWYNFSSTTYTVSGLQDATSSLDAAVFAFDFGKTAEVSATSVAAGAGWQRVAPIPEPGTAAMALLGIGMLIRRRRKA